MGFNDAILYAQRGKWEGVFGTIKELREKGLSPHVFCHGLHYARGAFEGIRGVPDINTGDLHLITFYEHMRRLCSSCHNLLLGDIDVEQTARVTGELVKRNVESGFLDLSKGCYIRHLVYTDRFVDEMGELQPGLGVFSQKHQKTMIIGLFPWGAYIKDNPRVRVHEDGITSPLRNSKATGNYGFGGLAKDIAMLNDFDEALITDPCPERNVLEGGGENVFIFNGRTAVTPDTSQDILPGTKRKVLLEMLRNYGVPVEERKLPLEEFMGADAAVFTGTAAGVVPIAEVFDPLTEKRTHFNTKHRITSDVTLEDVAEQYQRMIRGDSIDPVHLDLQRRIRTPLSDLLV